MKENILLVVLIPVVVGLVFAGLSTTEFYQNADLEIYDALLRTRPAIEERPEILLVDIDDTAIARVGTFPWSRDIMARGLMVMREFGARYAVFDIEYVDPSPRGVNGDVLEKQIPGILKSEFASISQNISDLFGAIQAGDIPITQAADYVNQLVELNEMSRVAVQSQVDAIARDNDTLLGQAAHFFGAAFFTVNMLDEAEDLITNEHQSYLLEHMSIPGVRVDEPIQRPGVPFEVPDVRAAIMPILTGGRGAGFPNVVIDGDGVQRRIDLITEYQGRYFGQLGLRPLLDWLGAPEVVVSQDAIRLEKAIWPDGGTKDVTIPLTPDGRMLINWPQDVFSDTFRHLSYWELVLNWRLEEHLIDNLGELENLLPEVFGSFLGPYHEAETIRADILNGGDPADVEQYATLRAQFIADVTALLESDTDVSLLTQIQEVLASDDLDPATREDYTYVRERMPPIFSAIRDIYGEYMTSRELLAEQLNGSLCIIGWTGTSTTDIGVTPFEEEFMNVGTHAAVVNTILQEDFLDILPWWISAALGVILALGVAFGIRKIRPLPAMLVGVGCAVAVVVADTAVFVITGVYVPMLSPLLATFVTFLGLTALKFLQSEREKASIRNAFSHYLSPDVVNEVVADPSKLKLGGDEKHLTAIFTDVKGFSTVSEKLDPTRLVALLNAYLTEMSDIILFEKGTIDKYEGDAIIAFFGAPLDFDDHAPRALRSAVRMKKAERTLNQRFRDEELSPDPLLTRIGVNTGAMVVGNMGTEKMMDYTIMGSAVNLAARLEGVNNQYGTWILTSQPTLDEAGDGFTVRRLDRVRVVGMTEPVRLYELVDEKSETGSDVLEGVEIFEEGLSFFENKEWEKARGRFSETLRVLPHDGPSGVFEKRCQEYLQKPPAASWDGVFNLTVK